ncbi:MAG: HAMP domain-containing histidine kinase, partial [Chitinophagales bacterium]|nr:HAMP domain-containing histidine kinase [Chitinophagales bacterium]
YFSILGVLCISMILFCIFLLSEKIFSILKRNPLSVVDTLLILLICSLLTGAYFLWSANGLPGLVVILWTVLFILILPYFGIRELGKLNITKIFLVVIFFCVSGASVLYYYGTQKEKLSRITYAKKLITDRDAVTEFLLSGLKNKIIEDPFVIQYFKSKQLSGKELDDRLRQLYFTEGFDRYTIHFYPFDQDGYLLYGSSNEFGSVTERGIKQGMQSIGTKDLFYSSSATENITYLNQFKIESNDSLLGSLYVSLESNSYNNSGVYPELLLSEKDKLPNVTPEYSYAIYNKRINSSAKANAQSSFQLVDGAGAFNYDYKLKWKFIEDEEFQFIEEAGSNHLVYHPKQDMLIVVTSSNIPALYFLSYFSFLFVVIFSLVAIILIFNLVFIYPRIKSVKNFMQYASMRSLIQGFFLIFILIMIIVIGYVTGQFFLRQFNTIAKTTVEEKMERVTETVSFMFKEHQVSEPDDAVTSSLLRNHIGQISEVQGNEVNFYNRTGDLITSSQPGIFEKGIISRKINPLAYYDLRKETQTMVVTEEKIGRLSFYSGYQTIRNENGKVLAYLNLPYYNSRENLNEQVGFFFVALVNILVIAIIVAGLMAPLISKQITLKLSLVAEKFKGVKVGSSNELIEWYANDEIGSLVNEYNKMILELKKSADRLVNTQRELAWREMAKQVAHEIKNPLTPMKLSIQHLQRAYAQDAPNLKELTEKVSKTLIEQIDNLSDIATVFSNFAKMPKAEIENVDVNEILRSVYELHKESGNAVIHLHTNAEQCVVSADKNHLISLFNNLILNAIQAIPQERMGRIDVITENSEGNLIISITDDGVGISEEEREKVFVPNFTTKSSGTGLGLAYSKKVAESFSGTISFTSQINVGTTFYVSLPLIDDLVSS